jgi:hypothetical protein
MKHKIGMRTPQKHKLVLMSPVSEPDDDDEAATTRILRDQFWLPRARLTTASVHQFSASGAESAPCAVRLTKKD